MGVILLARSGTVIMIVAVSVLMASGATAASEVFWTPAHEFAPPFSSGFLAWGDLDADGDDDVCLMSWKVYWNTGCPGPPEWQEEALPYFGGLPSCGGLQSMTLGDVDADGDLDLVCACWLCCSFRMVWNLGTPQEPVFQYGGAIAGNPNAYSTARAWFGDIDADGDLDLVANRPSGTVVVYENIGTPETPYWVYQGAIPNVHFNDSVGETALGDLDGDGDLDIVIGTYMSPLQCWENLGTPQVWSYAENPAMLTGVDGSIIRVMGVALPDVDCDGDPDLLLSTSGSPPHLYLNERITAVGPGSWGTIKALYR